MILLLQDVELTNKANLTKAAFRTPIEKSGFIPASSHSIQYLNLGLKYGEAATGRWPGEPIPFGFYRNREDELKIDQTINVSHFTPALLIRGNGGVIKNIGGRKDHGRRAWGQKILNNTESHFNFCNAQSAQN